MTDSYALHHYDYSSCRRSPPVGLDICIIRNERIAVHSLRGEGDLLGFAQPVIEDPGFELLSPSAAAEASVDRGEYPHSRPIYAGPSARNASHADNNCNLQDLLSERKLCKEQIMKAVPPKIEILFAIARS